MQPSDTLGPYLRQERPHEIGQMKTEHAKFIQI